MEMAALVALTLAVELGPWERVRSGGAGAGDEERLCLVDEVAELESRGLAEEEDVEELEGKAMVALVGCCGVDDVAGDAGCDAVGVECKVVVIVGIEEEEEGRGEETSGSGSGLMEGLDVGEEGSEERGLKAAGGDGDSSGSGGGGGGDGMAPVSAARPGMAAAADTVEWP